MSWKFPGGCVLGIGLLVVGCGEPHRGATTHYETGSIVEAESEERQVGLLVVGDRPEYEGSLDRSGPWTPVTVSAVIDAAFAEGTTVLVELGPGHGRDALDAIEGVEVVSELGFGTHVYELRVDHRFQGTVADSLAHLDAARLLEVNHLVESTRTPNDRIYNEQVPYMALIRAERAWEMQTNGAGVKVAVLDDLSAATNHKDLKGNVIPGGVDFTRAEKGGETRHSNHGLLVAGVIGAVGNNRRGISGVAWKARMILVGVLSDRNGDGRADGYVSTIAKGVHHALEKKARIINMSIGLRFTSRTLRNAMTAARRAGALVVTSAGNDDRSIEQNPVFPASYTHDNIITVASVDANGRRSSFSNYGRRSVDLGAPGAGIRSTIKGGRYGTGSGTSLASPMVAGAAALIWTKNPTLEAKEVRAIILNTVRGRTLRNGTVTGGVLDLEAALRATPKPPTPNELFVKGLYRDLLGRSADQGGLAHYAARLDQGLRRAVVVSDILRSTEYLRKLVEAEYERFLRRKADTAGRDAKVTLLQRSWTFKDLSATLVASQEYRDRYPPSEAWVRQLYLDILGRTGEAAGVSAHVAALVASRFNFSHRARVFLDSQEYHTKYVQKQYRSLLGRNPSSSELEAARNELADGDTLLGVLLSLASGQEYFNLQQR